MNKTMTHTIAPHPLPPPVGRRFVLPILLLAGMLAACGAEEEGQTREETLASRSSAGAAAEDPSHLGFAQGAENAPVTVIEFSDYGCPFCARFAQQTYPELHEEFVERGRVRWVFIPFVLGSFPNGELATRSGECAMDHGRFQEMKAELYGGQNRWKNTSSREAPGVFQEMAREAGLDPDSFRKCLQDNPVADRIRMHNQAAAAAGIRATPSFVVAGRRIEGAIPLDQFRLILDQLAGPSE